ncbi:MAG: AAA family ATPase, partial [Anaerolineae bacterium]|nr:AAA family ATPase [Anaerolineae bacterium]
MTTLKLLLLGPPCFEVDGTSVEINRRKAIALLAYMAVTQQAYNRDVLATLLWPEAPRNRARAGLRQTLWELNKALGENWIASKGETLSLQPDAEVWVDVHNFQALLAACQTHGHPVDEICIDCLPAMTEIMDLYRDDFLAGFSLADSPGFDEWQYLESESLRRKFAVALEQLANYYLVREDFEAAILYIRRWLALDPLLDTPNLILMQLYAWTGQRSAAVRQYRKYVQLLDREMGFAPREDISALYQRIQRGEEPPKVVTHGQGPPTVNGSEGQPPKQALPDLPLGARDEIRLATVLVAGFSNATDTAWDVHPEQMAEAADTLLQIATEAASKYEAQVDRLAGDSVQSVFGTQRLHEDDPERAIRAALEIQRLAQHHGLSLTVGISTGEVYLGPIKDAGSQGVTALGPVINLAARLQDKAKTGQIVVSAATHHHTQRAFKFAAFPVTIRGLLQPLTVYEVQQVLPRPEKMRGIEGLRSKLIGRADEYQKLKAALENVLLGRGQMVSLIGEAGLGKSRLVEELKQRTLAIQNDEVPLIWLESRCLELRTATAYWPFIDLLRIYLYRQTGANSEVERATALASTLEKLVQNGDLQGGPARAEEIRMLLNNLLSLKVDAGWEEQLKTIGPEQIQYQTFFAVYDFLISLTHSQPLILVLEDLHWADDLSLDLVGLLMEAVKTTPLLLVCVYRPGYQHKGLRLSALANRKCPEQYTEITLRELTPKQSQNMIESLLAVDVLPPGVENLALKQTLGNPFFMEEAIRVLIELGILYLDEEQPSSGNRWQIRSDVDLTIAVPESVQSIILSRVDRLTTELKQTLRSAAVIGHNFQSWILAQLVPQSIDLAQTLWNLEEAALIYREKIVPEEEYAFKHALIQESVYRTIPPRERATLHQQAAEALERRYHPDLSEWHDELAFHYSRSDMTEKAVEYLCQAGEKSRRAYLNDQAIRHFKEALKLYPKIPAGSSRLAPFTHWRLTALTG